MKNRILFLITLVLTIAALGCKKISTPDEASKAIFGTWRFKFDSGGFSGAGGSNRFNKNSTVEFTEKGFYTIYDDGKKVDKYRFSIETNNSNFTPYKIVFKKNKYGGYVFSVDSSELALFEGYADGFIYVFERE